MVDPNVKYYCTKCSEAVVGTGNQLYQGHIDGLETVGSETVIQKAADETKVPVTTLTNAANAIGTVIKNYISRGYRVVWEGAFGSGFKIKGGFDSEDDTFDPERHKLQPYFYALKNVRDAAADITPVNTLSKVSIAIYGAQDKTTKEQNSVTGGNTLLIQGKYVKLTVANADEGVYLVASDGTEYKAVIESSDQQTVDCHWATTVPAGEYRLELRGRAGNGTNRSLVTASIATFTVKAAE